jgi:biotin-(acetyl-CoA carboxylase) ligase
MAASNKKTGTPAPAPATKRSLTKANQQKLKRDYRDAEELERRVKAYQYRLRGWTLRRIGAELNVSYSTIKRDLDIMQKSMAHEFEDFDPNELVAEEMQGFSDLIQQAWTEYERGTNVHQRVKCLDFIRTVKVDRFNMLKNAGVIKPTPTEVNHNVAVGVGVVNWNDEVKKAASEAILQGLMEQKQLSEPSPDDYDLTNVIDLAVDPEEEDKEDEE